ncbi:MAG: penicillin-binding protein 1C [Verrucomicrobiales bacterium]|nr:penicillin-binding protein 1C [Verrucomicrobiales bacterium]
MKSKILKFFGFSLLLGGIVLYIVPLFFPLPENLGTSAPEGIVFLDEEGTVIRRMLDGDLRAEAPATFEEFPAVLIEATLAAEDSRFYQHNGIDLPGVLRSIRDALTHGRFTSGASTISQQTIKIYSPPRRRTFRTKLIETMTARKLEMFSSKEEIMTAYLNRLPYGNQFTGARAAARGYFNKPLSDLSAAEAALLAGLPNKPSRLNPFRNLVGAEKRSKWILMRMAEEDFLSEPDHDLACHETIQLQRGSVAEFNAPHFTDLITSQHPEITTCDEKAIRTTLNFQLQNFVEQTLTSELSRLVEKTGTRDDLQGAVVVIQNETGAIKSLTGSRSFFGSRSGQINGSWSPRSAGSTLKPFTYLLGFENGYTAASILADTPIEYITSTGSYQPVNFDRQFTGPVSIREALANSLNVPAVKLLNEVGGPEALHTRLKEGLNFSSLESDADKYGLGLTLGNAEVRLLELTNGYATIARLGEHRPYRLLAEEPPVPATGIFDHNACWLIADILSDNQARAKAFGLNSSLKLPFRTAAKTGTSTDFRDNWTVGFTPEYTVGVWVGRFDNQPLDKVSGAIGAAPIYHKVMAELYRKRKAIWYEVPGGVERKTVDRISGKAVTKAIDLPASRTRAEWFINGNFPHDATASDYSDTGLTILPSTYHSWWVNASAPVKQFSAIAKASEANPPLPATLRIVSPLEGTVALLDPDLPGNGNRFPLEVSSSDTSEIEWSSTTLTIRNENGKFWAILAPGEHEITARDNKTNAEAKTRFEIRAL